jgi:hypothetical protein
MLLFFMSKIITLKTLSNVIFFYFLFCFSTAFAGSVNSKPIEFSLEQSSFSGFEILTTGKSNLNKLAAKLSRELDGIKLIYSEEVLEATGAKGAYSYEDHLMLISSHAFNNDLIDDTLIHELIHAKLWASIRQGKPQLLTGVVYNNSPEAQTTAYGPFFGIDEVAATYFSFRLRINNIKTSLDLFSKGEANASEILENMIGIRIYLNRLMTMLETLKKGLADSPQMHKVTTPLELKKLNAKLGWQKIEQDQITIIVPESFNKEKLEKILAFSAYSLPELEKIDTAAFRLDQFSPKTQRVEFSAEVQKILSIANGIEKSFELNFPDIFELINSPL